MPTNGPSPYVPDASVFSQQANQQAVGMATTAVALWQAQDALAAELTMAALTHEAREQGLWSVATKQADANSARMAKQSEEWGRI
jgi:hypothetical protein